MTSLYPYNNYAVGCILYLLRRNVKGNFMPLHCKIYEIIELIEITLKIILLNIGPTKSLANCLTSRLSSFCCIVRDSAFSTL